MFFFKFQYMTILYSLLVLFAAVLVTTITSLYDLTIQLFNFHLDGTLCICQYKMTIGSQGARYGMYQQIRDHSFIMVWGQQLWGNIFLEPSCEGGSNIFRPLLVGGGSNNFWPYFSTTETFFLTFLMHENDQSVKKRNTQPMLIFGISRQISELHFFANFW